ncbi:hypothetical protein B0H13DRAFT_1879276 [Mycena leptocephala]|nr:hypothetical protein B0H13DRAFT_1879276 [Mycena leptocephala]
MPPLLFPPSPPGRGRVLDVSLPRSPSPTSPQPTFPGALETNHLTRYKLKLGYLRNPSRFDDGPGERYLPRSTTPFEDFLDETLMVAHYLDLPNNCSNIEQDSYNHLYPHSDSSVSSPEATATASSSGPRAEIFSTHSSPGYILQDLPDPINAARPHSGFSRHPPYASPHYTGSYGHHNHLDNMYHESLVLPRPASYQDSSVHQRPATNWGYPQTALPAALPSISQSSRYTMDLRRWPQMFKINQAKKVSAKKQMMACLFCRERKIRCTRPPRMRQTRGATSARVARGAAITRLNLGGGNILETA